ncbi:hypothetical protein M569_14863 [Genlisea aurea]|uniref:4-coumarate--CoA ligase n=1 Tax=Genlisea aurea TaxID=192259 RepID=S8BZG2_9LAMI|nr:hypothetical protein M569_14863 [Genlisea aurea]
MALSTAARVMRASRPQFAAFSSPKLNPHSLPANHFVSSAGVLKSKLPKGEFVPVFMAMGLIAMSTGFGVFTAWHQLRRAPNVSVRKSRRESFPEVDLPEETAEAADGFLKRSFFRKVAHVQAADEEEDRAMEDPIRGDVFTRPEGISPPMETPPPPKEVGGEIVFRSKFPDIYIPGHLPLHSYVFEKVSEFGSRPCLINGTTGEVFSYEQVELTSRKVAAGLSRQGIKRGDTVMILLQNAPEFVFVFLGASRIGAVSTTANPFFTSAEVIKQAAASGAKIVVTMACYVEKVKDFAAEKEIRIVCIDSPPPGCLHFSEISSAEEDELPPVKIHPDDVVALPYSSGTTGLPKGVMLTHKGMVTGVAQLVDGDNPNLYLHTNDVMICVLPLFHIFSLNSVLLCGLRRGAAILIVQKFEIVSFLDLIQKFRVTIGPLVPPIALAIDKSPVADKYDLSSVRIVLSGAAPLGKELVNSVQLKFPNAKIGQGYGMTEAGPVLAMCPSFAKEPVEIKSGACGTVVRNAEMKIVDVETGASLGRNQSGEICIRGDQIMKGYLNDAKATEATIDADGWLHSGDIGFIDADDELFIVDRLKEIIKYKGFQVAPAEIESLLIAHPAISDAAVVPMKDEEAGEVPVAFVVKSNGTHVTEDEIKQYISKQVVFYKRISRVFFVGAVPKSPAGKILRKQLREKLAADFPQ